MSNALCKLAMLLIVAAFPLGASAHDPRTHMADAWNNAKSKGGSLCCNGQDYDVVHHWRRVEAGFEVMLDPGKWTAVPPEAVVTNMINHTIEAKVWLWLENGQKRIRCFAPGAEI